MKYKLEIKSEQYYNNGNLMLRFLEDGKQEALEEKIREWLRCDCELTAKSRKNKQSGINANELNKALRNNLCIPFSIFCNCTGCHVGTSYDNSI